jgi:hypothetical protein
MSSFIRNIRGADSSRRSRALGAGVALTLMSGAALAGGAHRFVFTAYRDAAGGADVVAGRYRAALEELKGRPQAMALESSSVNTNRCVAYSMTLQFQQARAACDAAVHAAEEQRVLPSSWWSVTRASDDDDSTAVAYANRAVLHWMLHDEAAARADLARAQQLWPQAAFVARNLAALKVHAVVLAQAGTPAPKS